MRSVLIEPIGLCHQLSRIGNVTNVIGCSSGTEIAEQAAADVRAAGSCEVRLGQRCTAIQASSDQVAVDTDAGEIHEAPFVIVATGLRPQTPFETPWIEWLDDVTVPPLWNADPDHVMGGHALVLGVDRPLGTFLRTHPNLHTSLLVFYDGGEEYKAAEITDDPRVTLIPTRRLELHRTSTGSLHVRVTVDGGEQRAFAADPMFLNLGSRPVLPTGDLVRDAAGYCSPDEQHKRILVAGDVRAARGQRIMTAYGSGADAALRAYYSLQGVI